MSKNLSKKEFEILNLYATSNIKWTQREIENKLSYSLGTINKIVKDFTDDGILKGGLITDKGYEILEPYRAKKAIFIAAGFGSRLVPITLNTPKPLVRVYGERIIDGLIDAVLAIGINDIIIVRGYLADQFDQLLYKYPMIKFIENPLFNEANNISSAMVARFYFENAYVLESDLLVKNKNIIKKYHYQSDYLCSYTDRTDDWCFEVKDDIIANEKIGGINCYQMKGISYWNSEDGRKLSNHIELAYNEPGGKELYWEQVPIVKYKNEYKIAINVCNMNDVIEIDTFNDLKKIDKTYDI